ncbi:MAG TPA: ferritin-like domain-containing protein [Capsulimonadaceae bacterium]|nr:ferritin-like domain-containing protein [Capsulimonadaceae bacterium]
MSVLPEKDQDLKGEEYSQDRRAFLKRAGAMGMGLAAFGLLGGKANANTGSAGSNNDANIITAAATAEALACTMYANIITSPVFNVNLASEATDQAYIVGAFQEELDHYNLLVSAGGENLATTFYFPSNAFTDPQTMINTLIALEDSFIAAYLLGVRHFSTADLRVLAAQIMGIEAEHRVLGRDLAVDLGLTTTTGLSGEPEGVVAPMFSVNNIAYERTFRPPLDNIAKVLQALKPFVVPGAIGFSRVPFLIQLTLPSNVSPVLLATERPAA